MAQKQRCAVAAIASVAVIIAVVFVTSESGEQVLLAAYPPMPRNGLVAEHYENRALDREIADFLHTRGQAMAPTSQLIESNGDGAGDFDFSANGQDFDFPDGIKDPAFDGAVETENGLDRAYAASNGLDTLLPGPKPEEPKGTHGLLKAIDQTSDQYEDQPRKENVVGWKEIGRMEEKADKTLAPPVSVSSDVSSDAVSQNQAPIVQRAEVVGGVFPKPVVAVKSTPNPTATVAAVSANTMPYTEEDEDGSTKEVTTAPPSTVTNHISEHDDYYEDDVTTSASTTVRQSAKPVSSKVDDTSGGDIAFKHAPNYVMQHESHGKTITEQDPAFANTGGKTMQLQTTSKPEISTQKAHLALARTVNARDMVFYNVAKKEVAEDRAVTSRKDLAYKKGQ